MSIQLSTSQGMKWKANRIRRKERDVEEKPGGGGEEGDGWGGNRRGDKALDADATRTAGSLRFRVCVAGSSAGKAGEMKRMLERDEAAMIWRLANLWGWIAQPALRPGPCAIPRRDCREGQRSSQSTI